MSIKTLSEIAAFSRADEDVCVKRLIPLAQMPAAERFHVVNRARAWIEEMRKTHKPSIHVTELLARYGLSSQEGLALMCLAEALLRIPDQATADELIHDKLTEAHWDEALGSGASWMMNITGWALSLTGKVIQLNDVKEQSAGAALGRLVGRLGQPVIRELITTVMQWLANQFVMGETMEDALERAKPMMKDGVRFSFDRLGEAARTDDDAVRYFENYAAAIDAIGAFQRENVFARASGISVKLSALHPRYEQAQRDRVLKELLPRLIALCERASENEIPLTIDAEESDRLHLSLEIATELLIRARLGAWDGLGFAVQAYQKRAPFVIDYLIGLAREHRKIHIRLVKGAYWDTEIKHAQERGFADFPVFTRKESTDISYLACVKKMLDARGWIYPVFGTHNALTAAHIAEKAGEMKGIEFQRLHGMGEDLYRLMKREAANVCVYAPVGKHDVLLAYLVRRLLENGANSSFVYRVLDEKVSIERLTEDPIALLLKQDGVRHPAIRMPPELYGDARRNALGLDLADPFVTEPLLAEIERNRPDKTPPVLWSEERVPEAFDKATQAFAHWTQMHVEERALRLEKVADLLEENRAALMAHLIYESGKTLPDALGEVREAVDCCRYYATQARTDFKPQELQGPTGERNTLRLVGRGVFVCISPWNFPLAIFLGQVAAALAAGNSVIAKPASQTPRVAVFVASLMLKAGFPDDVFQLAVGDATIGAALVKHPAVAGVAFTGSTTTARSINRLLAEKDGPIVPLIAETGGQNAMIVDSSALPEQVVDDVITSAFRSAGQRCSALRVLFVPEETADILLTMLKGAMKELRVGNPAKLETDVGAVIDETAQQNLLAHVERLKKEAQEIFTAENVETGAARFYVAPQAWEIPSIGWLTGEVFGPILHVVRYPSANLADAIAAINATGFGLTGGIHSRLERTVKRVERELRVGNLYVNRSMIGAVVGVQPFGGEGLSGTGPKAGGPHYLPRFAHERVVSNNVTAAGGNASLLATMGDRE